jgi:hypothetical protein
MAFGIEKLIEGLSNHPLIAAQQREMRDDATRRDARLDAIERSILAIGANMQNIADRLQSIDQYVQIAVQRSDVGLVTITAMRREIAGLRAQLLVKPEEAHHVANGRAAGD